MYCRNCRKWFPNNILFCDICGKPLVKDLDIYGENFFNGDIQAFDYIYQNSYKWVAGEARKSFSANPSEVEDCVQEIYLLLYRKIKYYNPHQGSFSSWFNTLVRNRIYDYGRKLAGNREVLPETSQQYFKDITDRNVYINPEAKIEYAEREQILDEILDDIGEGQRLCIQMYYNDGLKIKEIAQILNISEGTVKSRIHNGLKKLNTKVDEMQRRGLYTFRMLPLGFFLWLLSREDCSAREDYQALYHAKTMAGQNVLQNTPQIAGAKAAGMKAAGIKMSGRNKNIAGHANMEQAGANHVARAAGAASKAGGKAVKAGMAKVLAGGLTVAVIGSGVFAGSKMLKQHQGDKKLITAGQEYSTQAEKAGSTKGSVKDFVENNQAFIKEILAMEMEMPEEAEFENDVNKNFSSMVDTSLLALYTNKLSDDNSTNIYDVVPKKNVVDSYDYSDTEGEDRIIVKESGFDMMREFLGCQEKVESLSKQGNTEYSYKDGKVESGNLYLAEYVGEALIDNKDIKYIPLSNGDIRVIFAGYVTSSLEGIGIAVITKADNDLGIQLKSYNVVIDQDKISKVLGAVSVLGKQLGSNGKLFSGDITEMSEETKIGALMDSVHGYCYNWDNGDEDPDKAEDLFYLPIFSKDDVENVTETALTVKADAFDDYLKFVDYDGTIDDIIDNQDLESKYECSIQKKGDNIEFYFNGNFEMTYWLVDTPTNYNKNGFEVIGDGKIKVHCRLYTMYDKAGVRYTAVISLNEEGSGIKLESLEKE